MGQFHFHPDEYLALMHSELPAYERLQDEAAAATGSGRARGDRGLGGRRPRRDRRRQAARVRGGGLTARSIASARRGASSGASAAVVMRIAEPGERRYGAPAATA